MLVCAGFAAMIAGCAAAAVVPAHLPGQRLAVLAAVLVWFGWATADVMAAAATAGMAWLFFDGFMVNRFGVLSWHGHADAVRLGVLASAAAAGTALGWAARGIAAVRNGFRTGAGPSADHAVSRRTAVPPVPPVPQLPGHRPVAGAAAFPTTRKGGPPVSAGRSPAIGD